MKMSEREFIMWLNGYVTAITDTPTPQQWSNLVKMLGELKLNHIDTERQLLHDGTINIVKDRSK